MGQTAPKNLEACLIPPRRAENVIVTSATRAVVLKEALPLHLDQPYCCNHWSSASMSGC